MDSADSLEAAREHAHAAIRLMERHGIAPHPDNYAIWYAYHRDRETAAAAPPMDPSTVELSALIRGIRQDSRRAADRTAALGSWLASAGRGLARRQDRTEEALGGATTDELTGLASRPCLEARLARQVFDLWRFGGALSLVIAGIDGFGPFNERHGRGIGDEVLFAFGKVLRDLAAERDTVARHGDAFAVLMPGGALDEAVALAEDLRRRLASRELVNVETGESYGSLTLSAGVAQFRLGEPPGTFVQRVERALRTAKRQGRNRVLADTRTAVEPHVAR